MSTHSVDDYSAAKPALVYKHIDVELNEILTMPFEKKKPVIHRQRTHAGRHAHDVHSTDTESTRQAKPRKIKQSKSAYE